MLIVLGDLIADLSLRIPHFPIQAQDLTAVNYLDIGPGGGGNIAIMVARFRLPVRYLGELGDDRFGQIVLEGLAREGIDTAAIVVAVGESTPVAGVIVDADGEPAYLGYRGNLQMTAFPKSWSELLPDAVALFADGWVETEGWAAIVLEGLRQARQAGLATFFDPGPGNPAIDNGWHEAAAAQAAVLLANEAEAARLSGRDDLLEAGRALLANGSELVLIKRGPAGCMLFRGDELELVPGFPVALRDATGAGDSLAGAVIFGYLNDLTLQELGRLGNAAGAAKVQKLGTGHNVPTVPEVMAVMERFGVDSAIHE